MDLLPEWSVVSLEGFFFRAETPPQGKCENAMPMFRLDTNLLECKSLWMQVIQVHDLMGWFAPLKSFSCETRDGVSVCLCCVLRCGFVDQKQFKMPLTQGKSEAGTMDSCEGDRRKHAAARERSKEFQHKATACSHTQTHSH